MYQIDRLLKLKSKKKILCLEVGCRWHKIKSYKKNLKIKVIGVDLSKSNNFWKKKFGIPLYRGTADNLKIKKNSVDILIYGFAYIFVMRKLWKHI